MNEKELRGLVEDILQNMSQGDLHAAASNSKGNVSANKETIKNAIADDGVIPDIRDVDYVNTLGVENPHNPEEYLRIKAKTGARLGVGRSGPRYKTGTFLRMLADHAGAIDAVLCDTPEEVLERNNLFTVSTICSDQNEYLARPDFGKQFSKETLDLLKQKCTMNPDVQVIVADGLSSTAVTDNIDDLLPSLERGFKAEGIKSGTPFFVKYGRVAAMDVITETLKSKVTIIFVGERPGLATYSSMSAYITFDGHVGMSESARTVVSNIYSEGTNPVEAGAHIASVVRKILDQKTSGTDLKL